MYNNIITVCPRTTLLRKSLQLSKISIEKKSLKAEKQGHFFTVQENAEAYSVIAVKSLLSLTRDEKKFNRTPSYILLFIRIKYAIF